MTGAPTGLVAASTPLTATVEPGSQLSPDRVTEVPGPPEPGAADSDGVPWTVTPTGIRPLPDPVSCRVPAPVAAAAGTVTEPEIAPPAGTVRAAPVVTVPALSL